MTAAGTEFSIKSITRDLLKYKSGILGISLLMVLIALSAYTIFVIPYDQAISLWRGEEGIWLEAPRNAKPYWINLLGNNLPETIVKDTRKQGEAGTVKIITAIPTTNMKLGRISFTFDFNYDDFPSEINLFLSAKYNTSAPLLRIYWFKPGESEIKLLDYVPRSKNDNLYLTTNQKVLNSITSYITNIVGEEPDIILPPERAMFAIEDETIKSTLTSKPQKGQYKLYIEATLS